MNKIILLSEVVDMTKIKTKALEVSQIEAVAEATSDMMPAVLAFSIGLFLVFGN